MSIARSILLWASTNKWLERQFRERGIAKLAVARFMPGERLEDALAASERIRDQRMGVVLTFLGENVSDAAQARAVTEHYLEVIDGVMKRKLDAQIAVKLTQLGLDLGADEAFANTRRIVLKARETGHLVWVDMEGSAYTQVTIDVFKRLRAEFDNVGLAVQAYLRRSPADVDALLALPASIRMVKGAYREPASIALESKSEIDAAYESLGLKMLRASLKPGSPLQVFGTHDDKLIESLRRAAAAEPGERRVEYHLLYGIRADEQQRLVQAGETVKVLISYGTHWYPWFVRRLAEKPSNVLFVFRNLFG